MENQEIKKEDKMDLKGVLNKLVDEEELEVENQIEAINNFKLKNSSSSDDSMDTTEEEEHLKRIKQELIKSLKRVEELEKQIFINKVEKRGNIKKGEFYGKEMTYTKNTSEKEETQQKTNEENGRDRNF